MHAIPTALFQELVGLLQANRLSELAVRAAGLTVEYPSDGRGWQMLGVAHLAAGQDREALPPLQQASELAPGSAAIWDNLGLNHFRLGDYGRAAGCFAQSTRLQPDRLTAWLNWSSCACAAGDPQLAEKYARQALKQRPDLPDVWLNLGNALSDLHRPVEAEDAFRQALSLRPDWNEAILSLSALLGRIGRYDEAVDWLGRLIAVEHGNWKAHYNLARILGDTGQPSRAIQSYRHAISLRPDAFDAYSGLIYHLLHDEEADAGTIFAEHRRYGEVVEEACRGCSFPHDNSPDPKRRLRIGFVSGDMREHAVAFFILPIFKAFDKRFMSLHVYANQPGEDSVTARLKAQTHGWRKVIGMNDEQLAAQIRADHIDILVDISGHTAYNRLPVFARKPAPIQVSWLGYPGTTGLAAVDYRPVPRALAAPGDLDEQFTEKLVFLPTASAFEPHPDSPPVAPLPALRNGYVTFGSLCRSNKIGLRMIDLWCQILLVVPNARLLIGAVADGSTADRLRQDFTARGIDAARLELYPRLPILEYLQLHDRIDLLLDSFPYTGGTTSLHALWMGVPVVTLDGDTLHRRVGSGVMLRAGMPEWVTRSADEYVGKAVAAAGDLEALAALRAGMRQRLLDSNILVGPEAMARGLERSFRIMWERWCQGLPAESFEVNP